MFVTHGVRQDGVEGLLREKLAGSTRSWIAARELGELGLEALAPAGERCSCSPQASGSPGVSGAHSGAIQTESPGSTVAPGATWRLETEMPLPASAKTVATGSLRPAWNASRSPAPGRRRGQIMDLAGADRAEAATRS